MHQATNEYLRSAVMTAPPEQLHLMLYDGAIRFTRQGLEGIRNRDWERAFNGLSRAQKIVLEMLNSLNYEVDRALCTRMAGLYHFVYQRLVEASTRRDVTLGVEALEILEYQRETWVLLIDRLKEEQASAGASREAAAAPWAGGLAVEAEDTEADKSYGTLSVHG